MSRRQGEDIDVHGDGHRWTLLSNHGHALLCLVAEPEIRLWELAQIVGVRERSAQRIVSDLVAAGYVSRERHGARVRYTVHRERPMSRPELSRHTVGDFVDSFRWRGTPADA